MLFNSYEFIFVFLPLVAMAHYVLCRNKAWLAAELFLTAASLLFYLYWRVSYLPVLLISIALNFFSAELIKISSGRKRAVMLFISVLGNVLALAYYKYTNFILSNVNSAFDVHFHHAHISLPLAISFFTFTQIAYLVDTYKRKVEEGNLVRYSLFVSFFPHLIAGPIIHHSEMMPQFGDRRRMRLWGLHSVNGVALFAIGLFKKIVIADQLARFANPVFNAADAGYALTSFEVWGAVIAYTFQLYFDFSGYCDMALGAARFFGIKLPINFDSPYKAVDIIDFWRRWHITLSRFLRDYVYIPLGGNRHGAPRRYTNLILTMLIGGIWHGAGWNFAIWGLLHGFYLLICHARNALRTKFNIPVLPRALAIFLTFLAVVVGWVFFRAKTLAGAMALLAAMVGHTSLLPDQYAFALLDHFHWLKSALAMAPSLEPTRWWVSLRDWLSVGLPLIAISAALAWAFPNSNELASRYENLTVLERKREVIIGLVGLMIIFVWALSKLSAPSEFLYFDF